MRRPAFSLIELVISVAIISILVATSALYASQARRTSRDSKRVNDASLIAQGVDQYFLASRGSYPKSSVGGASSAIMCSQEMSFLFPGLNLSIFPNNTIPTDPLPITPYISPCTSAEQGYRYHTQYGSQLSSAAFAQPTKVTYTIEILLEREPTNDTTTVITPAEAGLPDSTFPAVTSGRMRYLLNGRTCGASACYQ